MSLSYEWPVITIDGPSGTGKGTISQLVAQELNWNFLDSGALYRVLAFAAKQHSVDIQNEKALVVLAGHLDVQFPADTSRSISRVVFEGEDVTDAIRSEECGSNASKVAALPKVRKALLERQRAFCEKPGLVTDGRDMGTVVFPDAMLKIYLDADIEERAKRRHNQLKEKGINVSLRQVLEELAVRDVRDKERSVAPLRSAEDAIIIDTSKLRIEQVLDRILREARHRITATEETS